MKKGVILLPFLLLVFFVHTASCADWTERKLGKVIIKADKAARHKKWSRAIKYGEQMFLGVQALNQPSDARYINLLKNLNRYYDKAKRLDEVSARVEDAYFLSRKHLGKNNETTMMNRTLYYKSLISHRNFSLAIPLVLENIATLEQNENGNYKRHHYLKQLYSLYKMTRQFEEEEKILHQLLKLDKEIYGVPEADNVRIIMDLAENYCRQEKLVEFNALIKLHKLKYGC